MEDKLNDKWINIEEAAEYLGVKPVTLRGWIRNDKGIPAHKIGKQWKFKCSELDVWVKSGKSAVNPLYAVLNIEFNAIDFLAIILYLLLAKNPFLIHEVLS